MLIPSVGLCVSGKCMVAIRKTADWIRMLFGMVSRVGQGMGVLDGVPCAPRERGGFGGCSPTGFNGVFLAHAHIAPVDQF